MRLFLVDSSIFVFRAWYGPEPTRLNRLQQPNQAFIGFTDFVFRLLNEWAPKKIVFAFDGSRSQSFRREIYPQYKAHRSPAPVELTRQFGWCREWIEAIGISQVSGQGWEADDLIGSLVHYHRSPKLPVVILTADKDLAQLIEKGDLWWSFLDDKKLDYRAISKKFKVRPDQISDLLALTGDKADNIPGIPQVGMKTAANLLKKFESIESLRDRLDEVGSMKFRYAARVQQSLKDHRHLLDISAKLTRIVCDIESMRDVDLNRGEVDFLALERISNAQAMGAERQQRWLNLLGSTVANG